MNWRAYTGTAARLVAVSYLRTIGFMVFALLVIALSIDLTKTLGGLRTKAAATDMPLWNVLLPYMSYRTVDIVTRLLTTACLAGGFAAILLRHQRREDVVLAAAGMSPRVHLAALLAVGLVTGTVQAGFQNWLRPIAVKAQVESQMGRYGRWFGDTTLTARWIVDNDTAVRATVVRGANAQLQDVMIFEGLTAPYLTRLIQAESATPDPDTGKWWLNTVTLWAQDTDFRPVQSDQMALPLPLNAARLQWYEVHGYYLTTSVARQIATLTGTPAADDAATTLAFRRLAFFFPGIFVLLGASLAQAGISGRRLSAPRLVTLGALGYLSVVVVKSFWILGINGRIAPELAAILPLAIMICAATLLQLGQAGYLPRRRKPTPARI
ncbi:MAG: LptF/LptG family permease [Shimia sp.]|uniref:LptF/LptG family permease n=1 Tax=Shimia sp. TaxID=1954381 RepID=UPI004058E9E0